LDEGADEWQRITRRRRAADRAADGEFEDDEEFDVNIENYDCPLREWITKDRTKIEIRKRLSRFVRKTADASGKSVYHRKIREMCNNNRQSLEVCYKDLAKQDHLMAVWLADAPSVMLDLFDEVALTEVLRLYPSYGEIHPDVFVRITDLPIEDQIRDIRQAHLNTLIRVSGVVTRRTGVFPQLKNVTYQCMGCSYNVGPIFQNNSKEEERPNTCPECQQKDDGKSTAPRRCTVTTKSSRFKSRQGVFPRVAFPRSKEVIVLNDLIDLAKPGDEIEVTGVYTNNFEASLNTRQQGFPVFQTFIEANYVKRKGDLYSSDNLTDEGPRRNSQAQSRSEDYQAHHEVDCAVDSRPRRHQARHRARSLWRTRKVCQG
jgi:DNA replication licensing factor MCM2